MGLTKKNNIEHNKAGNRQFAFNYKKLTYTFVS